MKRVGRIATSSAEAQITAPNMDFRYDDNIGSGGDVGLTINKQDVSIYPWGRNNRLPNEMIRLLRSNGDVSNLLDARLDFLFGAGVGLFRRLNDKKDIVFEPYYNNDVANYLLDYELSEYVDGAATHMVECSTAFVNISKVGQYSKLTSMDPLTVRCERLKAGDFKKKRFVVSANWGSEGLKRGVIVPNYELGGASNPDETIFQLMRQQSGQFYYGYAKWWAAHEWITLANRIPKFHNVSLDTEYNVAYICRIADQYFDTMFQVEGIEEESDKKKYRDKFYQMMDDLIYNKEGQRRIIYDECPIGEDGKMHGWIDLIPIKRTITGTEYTELYRAAVLAFANASGILSQLSGISDGKVMGGSGSELRVTAEYQQFYRTPRERELILKLPNRVVLPEIKKAFGLPSDVVFGFNNILLESLNTAKNGSSQIGTGGPNATKSNQKSTQK
jgi:hypothetical protein